MYLVDILLEYIALNVYDETNFHFQISYVYMAAVKQIEHVEIFIVLK